MKTVIFIILTIVLLATWTQIYFIFKELSQSKEKFGILKTKADNLIAENAKIKSEIEYFSLPENLEKELRSKFNYKKPEEKMIIVVQ